jgi:hypothetical protein
MHLYLILEIALVYGRDVDDQARVPEMAAVVAATGLAAGTPIALQALEINPFYAIPASGLSAVTVAQLIGHAAIRYYGGPATEAAATPSPAPAS